MGEANVKRVTIFLIVGLFVFLSTTGCWTARYDYAGDNDYYYYPGHPDLDYINLLAPKTETPVAPVEAPTTK